MATWRSIINILQDLKQKLQHAKPDIAGPTKQQLSLHQFLADLPVSITKQLWAAGDVTRVDTAMEQAQLLMALEMQQEDKLSMVAATSALEQHQQVQELKKQVEVLTTQVATLVWQWTSTAPRMLWLPW